MNDAWWFESREKGHCAVRSGLTAVKNKVLTYTRLVFWIRSRIVTRAKVTLALRTGGESVKIINLLEKWFKYRNVPVGCRATRRRQTSAQREWNRDGRRARRGSQFDTTHSNAEHQRSKITREVKLYTLHHKVKQAPTRTRGVENILERSSQKSKAKYKVRIRLTASCTRFFPKRNMNKRRNGSWMYLTRPRMLL